MGNIILCTCGNYPGIHPCYKDCDKENDYVFLPSKEEMQFMKECNHRLCSTDTGPTYIFDGVCSACGTVVDIYAAEEATQRKGS